MSLEAIAAALEIAVVATVVETHAAAAVAVAAATHAVRKAAAITQSAWSTTRRISTSASVVINVAMDVGDVEDAEDAEDSLGC